jgi:hypothetical protein
MCGDTAVSNANAVAVAIELVTVDTTTDGKPTATLITTNASGTWTPAAGDRFDIISVPINGGTGVSVTAGTQFYLVTKAPAVIDALSVTLGYNFKEPFGTLAVYYGAGSWARDSNGASAILVKIGGTWYNAGVGAPTFPIGANNNNFVNTSSNPERYGVKMTMPFKCRVIGMAGKHDNNGDSKYVLLDASFAELGSISMDKEELTAVGADGYGAHGLFRRMFSTAITLNKDDVVYALIAPTTTTSIRIVFSEFNTAVSGIESALPGGSSVQHGSLNDSNSWAQQTGRAYWVTLIIDQIDDGASAGGGFPMGLGLLNTGVN